MSLSALYSSAASSAGDSVLSDSASNADSGSDSLSIVQPFGYSASTCGYCAEEKGQRSKRKTSKSYGVWAHALSCATYKILLDRGWRRSGAYLYKPDNARTCCVQYTISQGSSQFKPTRSQRQVLQRFRNFVIEGDRQGEKGWGPAPATSTSAAGGGGGGGGGEGSSKDMVQGEEGGKSTTTTTTLDKGKGKAKAKHQAPVEFGELVHGGDWNRSTVEHPFKNKFQYIVEPASFTAEKYALFKRYQMEVHGEPESKVSVKGFKRFLVDSPLDVEPTSVPGIELGSKHALYRLNGVLIAFAVLDLLPSAVSSVYFVWNPDWSGMSLGKVSALREIQMVREMEERGVWEKGKGRYMMGYYIEVPKMRYKADYQPSFLLDPATNAYYPWEHCKPLLAASMPRAASFSNPAANPPPPLEPSSSISASSAARDNELMRGGEGREELDEEDEDDEDDGEQSFPTPPPLGCLDPTRLPKTLLLNSYVLEMRTLVPLLLSTAWHDPEMQQEVKELLATTGEACQGRLAIWTGK